MKGNYLLSTEFDDAWGHNRMGGRVLLAWDPHDTEGFEAGAYWVKEAGQKKLQSVYVAPLFRGRGGAVLATALKQIGVTRAVGPFSDAGAAYTKRHNFRIVD